MKKLRVLIFVFSSVIILGGTLESSAQCAMCRQAAESNLKQGGNERGKGLNNAILYLMSVPYIMGGVGGYLLWRNRRK